MFRLSVLFRFFSFKGRTVLSILAIALGVALGFAVHLINAAAVNELAAGVRTLAGEADLEVRGGRAGFPEALYAQLARVPGVAVASPVLEAEAAIAGSRQSIRLVGIDPLRAGLMQPLLFGDAPGRRLELLKPDVVYLSVNLPETKTLKIVSGLETIELQVAGVLPSLRGATALTDIATAQWRLGRLGELNRIDLRLAPGVDREAMRRQIAALLPPGVHVSALDAVEESSANLSRAYRVNLNVLALVALFTGGFLVFSAQALEVTRRRQEHALLRVLGLERSGVLRLVLAEAAALGALGGALGIALGYAIALAATRAGAADLGAGFFRGVTPQVAFPAAGSVAFFLGGIAVALAGALLPALDAARAAPAQALRAGDEQNMFARATRVWPGIVLVLVAVVLLPVKPLNGIPVAGYASIACLLLGGIFLMPFVSEFILKRIKTSRSIPGTLALAQLRGAPGQAMVSLAAIVASFSLMVAMAIMVASFRTSVDEWLGAVLPADLYFRSAQAGETAWLDAAFEQQVRALPQVERAVFLRSTRIVLRAGSPPVALIARDGMETRFPLVGKAYERKAGDPPAAWISEATADLYGFSPGSLVKLPLAGKEQTFIVTGVWRDYARQFGAIVIERGTYIAFTGDRRANDAALWLKPGADVASATQSLRALPGGKVLDINGPGEIRRTSLAIFDRSFAVTYALEAVAVIVGLFGLSSSVGAIVLARRREFGMLRHLGMTRRQIGAMLAAEGGLLALLGVAAGLLLGSAISLILIHVVNRQSFNWSMDLHPPYGLLFWIVFGSCAFGGHNGTCFRTGSHRHRPGARSEGGLVNRRDFLAAGIAFSLVTPDYRLEFPRDHGAHPGYRQEWWYLTGWLKTARGEDLGFQITFFRTRLNFANSNPSSFTPSQIILAHAALSDPRHGRLRHDERAARTALGLAGSGEGNTKVWVDDWHLELKKDSYVARIQARDFSLDLQFDSRNAPVLQGDSGFSRKGNRPEEASYYYSRPQLSVRGSVNKEKIVGTAWLDHEWSSQYMAANAAGWDWCGINLDDGGSLMAFRMRDKEGRTAYAPPGVSFEILKSWKSPRTGTVYPVAMLVNNDLRLEPLMDDQELDARASTGTIYWEGAVRAMRAGKQVGRGYLELTGYWRPMKV